MRVPVHRFGKIVAFAQVDAADYALVIQRRWSLGTDGYPVTTVPGTGGQGHVRLHRLLMNPAEWEVDHRNGDRLDHRRTNLRLIPGRAEQAQNVRSHRDSTSRFRGVSLDRHTGRWRAAVRSKRLGRFDSELEAAQAAEAERLRVMPWAEPDPLLAEVVR